MRNNYARLAMLAALAFTSHAFAAADPAKEQTAEQAPAAR
jgi:hypothetical protein